MGGCICIHVGQGCVVEGDSGGCIVHVLESNFHEMMSSKAVRRPRTDSYVWDIDSITHMNILHVLFVPFPRGLDVISWKLEVEVEVISRGGWRQ